MMTSIADIKRVFIDTSAWIDLMNSNEFLPYSVCNATIGSSLEARTAG